MTQTDSGKVRFVPSPQSNVTVIFRMLEPHCEQIPFGDALAASEKETALTICRCDFSKISLLENRGLIPAQEAAHIGASFVENCSTIRFDYQWLRLSSYYVIPEGVLE